MNAAPNTVSPLDVYQQLGSDTQAILIDVRTAAEYQAMHAHGARLVPLDEFDAFSLEDSGLGRDKLIYITCHSGRRAVQAAERLAEHGYPNVAVVQGGIQAWASAGLPVVRGRQMISLERQVQIALGVLVLLKVGLGFAIHDAFFLVLAALGLGLVVAGVTANCALARVIAKMPWNRRAGTNAPASA